MVCVSNRHAITGSTWSGTPATSFQYQPPIYKIPKWLVWCFAQQIRCIWFFSKWKQHCGHTWFHHFYSHCSQSSSHFWLVTGIISDIIGIMQWHYLYVLSAPNICICIWILTWSGCGLNQNGGVLWGFSSWKLCRALGEKTDVEISAVSARCVNSDSSLDSYLVTSLLDVVTDVISGAVVQSHCGTWSGFYY